MSATDASLRAVAEVTSGQSAPQGAEKFSDAGIPFVRAGSLESLVNGATEEELEQIDEEVASEHRLRLFPRDTVLFAKSGMSATLGRVYRLKRPAYVVSHLAAIIAGSKLDPRYLQRWLEYNPPSRLVPNASYPSISLSAIANLEIPLPPLPEQQRIADILDKADTIRRKRRDTVCLLQKLLDSIFHEMFGDVATKRSRHPIQPLRPYLTAANGKSSGKVLSSQPTGIPVYGGNGVNGWATQALYDQPVLVVGRVGQQCGITHRTTGPAWITDNAIAVQVADESKLHLEYLEAALRKSTLGHDVRYIDLPYINQSMIKDLPLPLPPLKDQLLFVKRKAAVQKPLEMHTQNLEEAENLFNSLVQCAFRGEL